MNGKIDTGGPAFPSEQGHIPDGTWNQTYDPGMTLLDEFAAHERDVPAFAEDRGKHEHADVAALIGIKPEDFDPVKHWPTALAKWRYRCAIAMVAEKRRLEGDAHGADSQASRVKEAVAILRKYFPNDGDGLDDAAVIVQVSKMATIKMREGPTAALLDACRNCLSSADGADGDLPSALRHLASDLNGAFDRDPALVACWGDWLEETARRIEAAMKGTP